MVQFHERVYSLFGSALGVEQLASAAFYPPFHTLLCGHHAKLWPVALCPSLPGLRSCGPTRLHGPTGSYHSAIPNADPQPQDIEATGGVDGTGASATA